MFRVAMIVILLSLPAALFSQGLADEEVAIAAVLKSGGSVFRDENLPGKPVIKVELTACQIEPPDFEKLRFLKRLQHLDL